MITKKKINKNGFTIIELMIATAVFSVALLVLAVAVININHQYFKGISLGDVQTASSNILSDISSSIEFSNGDLTSGTLNNNSQQGYYCIGHTQFYYQLDKIDQPNQPNPFTETNQCLEKPPTSQNCSHSSGCSFANLLGKNMQLINFSISQQSNLNLFTVKLEIAFTSKDSLFCHLSQGQCLSFKNNQDFENFMNNHPNTKIFCLPNNPVDFCSIQTLSTKVASRYNGNG